MPTMSADERGRYYGKTPNLQGIEETCRPCNALKRCCWFIRLGGLGYLPCSRVQVGLDRIDTPGHLLGEAARAISRQSEPPSLSVAIGAIPPNAAGHGPARSREMATLAMLSKAGLGAMHQFRSAIWPRQEAEEIRTLQ